MFRFHERGGSFDTFVEVFESFGSFRPDAYEAFHRRRLWHSCRDMVGDDAFAGTDYHLMSAALQRYTMSFFVSRWVAGITTAPSLCSATMLNQNS